jgi:hypothetical protein
VLILRFHLSKRHSTKVSLPPIWEFLARGVDGRLLDHLFISTCFKIDIAIRGRDVPVPVGQVVRVPEFIEPLNIEDLKIKRVWRSGVQVDFEVVDVLENESARGDPEGKIGAWRNGIDPLKDIVQVKNEFIVEGLCVAEEGHGINLGVMPAHPGKVDFCPGFLLEFIRLLHAQR